MAVSNISIFVILMLCLFSQVAFGWIRFRYPYSRRVYMQQTALERLQNCGGLKKEQCGVCGEGPGDIPTSAIPEQNYLPIMLDNNMIDIEVAFHSDLGGHFEFRLCGIEPDMVESNRKCLQSAPLQLIGDRSSYYPVTRQTSVRLPVIFPTGASCDMCLLQVKYTPDKPAEGLGNFTYYDCAPVSLSSPTNQVNINRVQSRLPSGRSIDTSRNRIDNSRVASLLLGRTGGVDNTREVINRRDGQNTNGVNFGGSADASGFTLTSFNLTTLTDTQPISSIRLQNRTNVVIRREPELNTRRATIHRLVINRNQPGEFVGNNSVNTYQEEPVNELIDNRVADQFNNVALNDEQRSRTTRIEGITFAGDTVSRQGQIFGDGQNVDGTSRMDVSGVVTNSRVSASAPIFSTRNIMLQQNPNTINVERVTAINREFNTENTDLNVLTDNTLSRNTMMETTNTVTNSIENSNIESNTDRTLSGDTSGNSNMVSRTTSSQNTGSRINMANNNDNGRIFSRRVDMVSNNNEPNNGITRTTLLTINTGRNGIIDNEQMGTSMTAGNVNTDNSGLSVDLISRSPMRNDRTIATDRNRLGNFVDTSSEGSRLITENTLRNDGFSNGRTMSGGRTFSTVITDGNTFNSNTFIDGSFSANKVDNTNTNRIIEVNTVNETPKISNTVETIGRTTFDNNVITEGMEPAYTADSSNGGVVTAQDIDTNDNIMKNRTVSTKTMNLNTINFERNVSPDNINTEYFPQRSSNDGNVRTDNTLSRLTVIDVNPERNMNTEVVTPVDTVNGGRSIFSENNVASSNIGVVYDSTLSRNTGENVNIDKVINDGTALLSTSDIVNGGRTVVSTFGRISGDMQPTWETLSNLPNNEIASDNVLLSIADRGSFKDEQIGSIQSKQNETFINNQNIVFTDERQNSSISSSTLKTGRDIGTLPNRRVSTRNNARVGLDIVDDRAFRTIDRQDSLANMFARISGIGRTGSVDVNQMTENNRNIVETLDDPILDVRSGSTRTAKTINRTATRLTGRDNAINANDMAFIDRFGAGDVIDVSRPNIPVRNERTRQGTNTFISGLISTGEIPNRFTNDRALPSDIASQNNVASNSNIGFENSLFNEMGQDNVLDTGFNTDNTRTGSIIGQSESGRTTGLMNELIGTDNFVVDRQQGTRLNNSNLMNKEINSTVDASNILTSEITDISYLDSSSTITNGSAVDNIILTNDSDIYTSLNKGQETTVSQEMLFSNETSYNNQSIDVTFENSLNTYVKNGSSYKPVNETTEISITSDFSSMVNTSDDYLAFVNRSYTSYDSINDSHNFTLTDASTTNINVDGTNITSIDSGFVDVTKTNVSISTLNDIPLNDVRSLYEFETTTTISEPRNVMNVETNSQGKFQQEVVSVPNTITVFPIDFRTVDPVIPYTASPVDTGFISINEDRHKTVYDNVIISSNNIQSAISGQINIQSEIKSKTTEIPLPVKQRVTETAFPILAQTTDPFDVYFQNMETTTIPTDMVTEAESSITYQNAVVTRDNRRYENIETVSNQQQPNNGNGQKIVGIGMDSIQTVKVENTIDAQINSSLVSRTSNETSNILTNTHNLTVYDNIIIDRYPPRDISLEMSSTIKKDTLSSDHTKISSESSTGVYNMPTTTDSAKRDIIVNDWNTNQYVGERSSLETIPYIGIESTTTSYVKVPFVEQIQTTTTTQAPMLDVDQARGSVSIGTVPSRVVYDTPTTTTQYPKWTFEDIYSTTTVPPTVDVMPTRTRRPDSSVALMDKTSSSTGMQNTNYETILVKNPSNIYIAGDSVSVVNVSRSVEQQGSKDQYVDLINNVDMYGGVPITGATGDTYNKGTFFVSSNSGSSNSILQSVDGSSFDVTNSLVPVANRPIVDDRTSIIQALDSKSADSSRINLQTGFIVFNTTNTGDFTLNSKETTPQNSKQIVVATKTNEFIDSPNVADLAAKAVNSNTDIVNDRTIFDTDRTVASTVLNTAATSTLENDQRIVNNDFNTVNFGPSSSSSTLFDPSQISVDTSGMQNGIKSESKTPIATSTVWKSIGVSGDNSLIDNRAFQKTWKGDVNDPMSYHFFTLVNGDSNTQYLGSQPQSTMSSSSVDISNTFDTIKNPVDPVSKRESNRDILYKRENVSSTVDSKVNNNLTSSTLWDLNRMNKGLKDETSGSTNEYSQNVFITTNDNKNVENGNAIKVTRTRNYRILVDPQSPNTMPPISAKDTQVKIISQYQNRNITEKNSDINNKVLKTLEQLVLELKQNQDTTTTSNIMEPIQVRPRVESTVTNIRSYESAKSDTFQIDPINALNVLYVEDGISKGIPPPIIPGFKAPTILNANTGTRTRLSNLKAASAERKWTNGFENSQVSLGSLGGLNNKTYQPEQTTVQQPVIALPKKKGSMYDILLGNFANVSTSSGNETVVARLRVETKADRMSDQKITTKMNMIETTTNIVNAVTPIQEVNNADLVKHESKERLIRQRIIQASEGQISNPFSGIDTRVDNSMDKIFANQMSADPQYRDAPQVSGNTPFNRVQTSMIRSDPNLKDSNQIAIEGKYYIGEMRRNDFGQFEPVPVGADIALNDRVLVAPSNEASQTIDIVKVNNENLKPSNDIKTNFNNNMRLSIESNTNKKFIDQDKLLSLIKEQQQVSNTVLDAITPVTMKTSAKVRRLPNSSSLSPVPKVKVCGQGQEFVCEAVGSHKKVPGMVWWCFSHCKNGVCPEEKCKCACTTANQAQPIVKTIKPLVHENKSFVKQIKPIHVMQKPAIKTRVKKVISLTLNGSKETMVPVENTVIEEPKTQKFEKTVLKDTMKPKTLYVATKDRYTACRGINAFARTQGIDQWCTTMCERNVCPPEICAC